MPGKRGDLATRFWAKVDKRGPGECWPWTGAVQSRGYGHISRGQRDEGMALAHRVAYEVQTGQALRRDQTIDHTCECKLCMNAGHYDVVGRVENAIRRNARMQAAFVGRILGDDRPPLTDRDFELNDDVQEAA